MGVRTFSAGALSATTAGTTTALPPNPLDAPMPLPLPFALAGANALLVSWQRHQSRRRGGSGFNSGGVFSAQRFRLVSYDS
jgi:hypothetical protein